LQSIKGIIGVVKEYATRVGNGLFPTEQLNDTGSQLQSIGKEVGVTTGRTRRTGYLDLVITRYSHDMNEYTALYLTKLDILDSLEEISVAVGYSYQGEKSKSFSESPLELEQVEVEYKSLPGWKSSTKGLRKWEDLPEKAKEYVRFVEDFVGVKVKYIGTGPGREDMIYRKGAVAHS
jgi:adenylosuccinate synthase